MNGSEKLLMLLQMSSCGRLVRLFETDDNKRPEKDKKVDDTTIATDWPWQVTR